MSKLSTFFILCKGQQASSSIIKDSRRGHRSGIWNNFTSKKSSTGEEKAYCNHCSAMYQIGGAGNMKNHLISKHPHILPKERQSVLTSDNLGLAYPVKLPNVQYNFLLFLSITSKFIN